MTQKGPLQKWHNGFELAHPCAPLFNFWIYFIITKLPSNYQQSIVYIGYLKKITLILISLSSPSEYWFCADFKNNEHRIIELSSRYRFCSVSGYLAVTKDAGILQNILLLITVYQKSKTILKFKRWFDIVDEITVALLSAIFFLCILTWVNKRLKISGKYWIKVCT